jgi:two-component system, NarL family, sensor histidine kinase UhpB
MTDPELKRLGPETETACFRIALEALSNVIRHAQAQKVAVELRRDDSTLHLIIRDDGVGFDSSNVAKRASHDQLGLIGMRERATVLGGEFQCESAPGRGTEVRASFPIHPNEAPESEIR